MLRACQAAGVFHGLGAGYRWSPRSGRSAGSSTTASSARSGASAPRSCSTTRPTRTCPSLWRFKQAPGGRRDRRSIPAITWSTSPGSSSARSRASRRCRRPSSPTPAARRRRGRQPRRRRRRTGARETGRVDVEDAAAALLTFAGGAYGVLETSRVAIGKRVSLQIEVYGSTGLGRLGPRATGRVPRLPARRPVTFGFRRVLVNPGHPGAGELLIGGTDGTVDRLARPGMRDVGRVPRRDRARAVPARPTSPMASATAPSSMRSYAAAASGTDARSCCRTGSERHRGGTVTTVDRERAANAASARTPRRAGRSRRPSPQKLFARAARSRRAASRARVAARPRIRCS